MKRKLCLVLLVAFAACLLVGCGKKAKNTYDITVWVSESDGVADLTKAQIVKYNSEHKDYNFNATVEGISEKDSATSMITDVAGGADIYCFAQDQLNRLIEASALNPLGVETTKTVTDMNDVASVKAATVGGKLYCYPLTSDNGYYMYYDKSVIEADHIDSLEEIINDCVTKGKMFSFELETSAWYNASFFFATGCHSNWTTDTTGKFTSVDDDFNSDNGVIALRGMQKLLKSACYISSSNAADFSAATPSAVVISGTWASTVAQKALGDNYAAAKLPSFTVDGKSYQLTSFSGNKLMGVKPQADAVKAAGLQSLALYLTGEACQTERLEKFGWGPSNKNAQNTDTFKNNVALKALAEQAPYSIPQGQIHGGWWDVAKTYATSAKNAELDDTTALKAALEKYKEKIDFILNLTDAQLNAYTVIGKFGTANWNTDELMTQDGTTGVWYSNNKITFVEGDEFKCRKGLSWDVSFGDGTNNFKVTAENAGEKYVKFTYNSKDNTGKIELVDTNPLIK